ncbi:MAG: HNH endonuclease [Clostridiales bacterium]|nr:HNH endonuclease [Clostridiales bacterium]
MKDYKLKIELVPDSCWYSNLRSLLKPSMWDVLRKKAYANANGHCQICGRKVNRLEAHERWDYDKETSTQKLKEIVAVCHNCHSVIHIGRTQLLGKGEEAEKWFIKVNDCSYADFIKHLGEANKIHQERNKVLEWKLDLTYLEDFLK